MGIPAQQVRNLLRLGVHVRMQSVLLSFAAAGAIVLGATTATALPASAAPASALRASSVLISPAGSAASDIRLNSSRDVGAILCNGNLCIQRITAIINNKAT